MRVSHHFFKQIECSNSQFKRKGFIKSRKHKTKRAAAGTQPKVLPTNDGFPKNQPPRPTQNKYPMKRWLGGYGIRTEACLVWCRHSLGASRITSEKCCFLFLWLWCGPNRRMPKEGIWWLWISHFYSDSFLLFRQIVGSWEVFCYTISRLCQVYRADWGIGNVASSIFLVRLFWYTHCLSPKKMVLL